LVGIGGSQIAEKIIILSDGTGNSASSIWPTKVWRIFQTLDQRERAGRQI